MLDMLAQYEAEEAATEGRARKPRGPPPLTAMPCSTSQPNQQGSDGKYGRPQFAQNVACAPINKLEGGGRIHNYNNLTDLATNRLSKL